MKGLTDAQDSDKSELRLRSTHQLRCDLDHGAPGALHAQRAMHLHVPFFCNQVQRTRNTSHLHNAQSSLWLSLLSGSPDGGDQPLFGKQFSGKLLGNVDWRTHSWVAFQQSDGF
jgi:hypothetical protein